MGALAVRAFVGSGCLVAVVILADMIAISCNSDGSMPITSTSG
jgi:hypothetical protein